MKKVVFLAETEGSLQGHINTLKEIESITDSDIPFEGIILPKKVSIARNFEGAEYKKDVPELIMNSLKDVDLEKDTPIVLCSAHLAIHLPYMYENCSAAKKLNFIDLVESFSSILKQSSSLNSGSAGIIGTKNLVSSDYLKKQNEIVIPNEFEIEEVMKAIVKLRNGDLDKDSIENHGLENVIKTYQKNGITSLLGTCGLINPHVYRVGMVEKAEYVKDVYKRFVHKTNIKKGTVINYYDSREINTLNASMQVLGCC